MTWCAVKRKGWLLYFLRSARMSSSIKYFKHLGVEVNLIISIGFMVLGLVSCGEKSVISNKIKVQTTAEAYGDGNHSIWPLVLPLADQEKSRFDSPIQKLDFIAGGFAKMFMNLGAGMGMGKIQLTMNQPMPEIPVDYIKGLKIKRLFLYIEPTKGNRTKTWVRRSFWGEGDVNFNFLEKMVVRISPGHIEKVESWYPDFTHKMLKNREFSPLERLFDESDRIYDNQIDLNKRSELVVLKYDRDNRSRYLKNDLHGITYVVNAKQPGRAKKYLSSHPKFRGYFKQIQLLNNSLVVELNKDPIVEEGFASILSDNADELESLGVSIIEKCNETTCLDLEVPDVDLLPLIIQQNGLTVNAFINATKAPESFELKGFVEFEVRVKLSF
jgi:hypothetical protein